MIRRLLVSVVAILLGLVLAGSAGLLVGAVSAGGAATGDGVVLADVYLQHPRGSG